MNSIPRTSGIYQILCVPTGKIYIGSAANLWQRRRDHFKTLRGNRHANTHLQRAWNKYSAAAFTFTIVEFVERDGLIEAEQRWLDAMRSYEADRGFNICRIAYSSFGVSCTEDKRVSISIAKSITQTGFIAPDGNPVIIENLRSFCLERGLNLASMRALSRGKQIEHQGWRHINAPNRKPGNGKWKWWRGFVDPQGIEVEPFPSLSIFCKEHNLTRPSMLRLYQGETQSYKGWTYRSEQQDG